MLGILIYIYFLLIGYTYSCCIFRNKDVYFRSWMGGVFGNVALMAGIVLSSFIFGFTYMSHIILMLLVLVPIAWQIKKNGVSEFQAILGIQKPVRKTKSKDSPKVVPCMDWRIFTFLILPISIIIWALFANHILVPNATGGVTTGQSTYGDLRLHLSLITSIAEQGTFPPDYSIMPGNIIGYPFFIDMLSSSLFLFGSSLRTAIIFPSCVISTLLVMGFYITAAKLTGKTSSAILATVLFFFGGGFGFAYFLEGAKSNPENFNQIFSAWYHLPTNLRADGEFYKNIHWANPINDMIIPQRTTMAGWCMFWPLIWMLTEAVQTKERRLFIMLGVVSGCTLMIHTHTFMAFGIICAVMFFMYLASANATAEKKKYIINWVIFGTITAIMILPQLFIWTFRQVGGDSFISLHFNWDNNNGPMRDPYLWFYLKNWGITALFAVPAILCANKDNKKLISGAALVFIIAETILFQPLEYDNNKLFFIAYMLLVILVADWLVLMWKKLKDVPARSYLAVIVIIAGTFSGTLSICREYVSGIKDGEPYSKIQMFSGDEVAMADYIRENTQKDAVILTSSEFYSPVYALTGRDIYAGPSNFVSTHGLDKDYSVMVNNLKNAYAGSAETLMKFCMDNGIDYIYCGNAERSIANPETMAKLDVVHQQGTETLYKVR